MTTNLPRPDAPLSGAALEDMIEALARCSDEPDRLTRLYLSPAHAAGMDLVAGWMRAAGMGVHRDAAANIVGRYEGAQADAPALLIGSHIDTVRNAGKYDGNLGVLTGIAVVADLARRGLRLPFAIEVIGFGDEEGVRYPTTLSGSKAIAGRFAPACLEETDADGTSRRDALAAFGCDPSAIAAVARDPARVVGYVEVHIEQGPVLEARGLPVGVVTAINGCSRGEVTVRGFAGHAGTLPMDMRRDALAAAAEMVLAVEARGSAEGGLVATVGTLSVPGGAINVVAGQVRFTLDVRSASDAQRQAAVADIRARIAGIAGRRGVEAEVDIRYDAPATPCDPDWRRLLAEAGREQGVQPFELGSGAGHDAMAFGGLWPLAMLFLRCRGGVSHNPAEHAAAADMEIAARTLLRFIERLAA